MTDSTPATAATTELDRMLAGCVPQCPEPAAHAAPAKGATGALRQLTHERDLLADALGRVLVASGVASNVPLTGPQLLLLADDLVELQLSEKEALERVQAVIYKYRLLPHYTEWAIAAMVLDALRWPRSDGTVPDA